MASPRPASTVSSQYDTTTEPLISLSTSPSPSPPPSAHPTSRSSTLQTPWIPVAAASGACAAFNGVFAKLTTTELTTTFSATISASLGLDPSNAPIEFLLRGTFFILNTLSNILMWYLFTLALTRSPSTTRVALINTSSNFLLTALAGFVLFSEALPPLWWVGAMGLVVGNVIIGRRDGDGGKKGGEGSGEEGEDGEGLVGLRERGYGSGGRGEGVGEGEARTTSRERREREQGVVTRRDG